MPYAVSFAHACRQSTLERGALSSLKSHEHHSFNNRPLTHGARRGIAHDQSITLRNALYVRQLTWDRNSDPQRERFGSDLVIVMFPPSQGCVSTQYRASSESSPGIPARDSNQRRVA